MTKRGAIMVVLFLFGWGVHAQSASQTPPSINWKALEEAWTGFATAPTDEGMDKIIALLPERGKVWDNASAGAATIDIIAQGIGQLESLVYEKNPKAARLAFRLFTISFGSFEERLAKIIGNLIGFDTQLFLREMQVHQNIIPNMELVLASFRFGAPSPEDMEIERKYRIRVLESVEDKTLKDIRNECLKILRKLKI